MRELRTAWWPADLPSDDAWARLLGPGRARRRCAACGGADHGRPTWTATAPAAAAAWSVSASRAGGHLLVGALPAHLGTVGVDVVVAPVTGVDPALVHHPGDEPDPDLTHAWAVKEAWSKARGTGLVLEPMPRLRLADLPAGAVRGLPSPPGLRAVAVVLAAGPRLRPRAPSPAARPR